MPDMLYLSEFKRIFKILHVFLKYRLFALVYKDIYREHISDKSCSCEIDREHRARAAKLREAFEELGVTFIKLGQMLSRRPDLVPQAYILELEKLQDNVPPLDFSLIKKEIEKECICTLQSHKTNKKHSPFCYHCSGIISVFDEFDEKPIASASIAQVYKAKLEEKYVAVKVVKPGVIDQVNLDLKILNSLPFLFSRILRIDTRPFLDEVKRKLLEEFDLRNEALNMEVFRENFKNSKDIKTPEVYWKYSRENLLVMEFIEGTPLRNAILSENEKKKLARIIGGSFFKQIYFDSFFHSDPHPGNIFVEKDHSIAFVDFGGVGRIDSSIRKEIRQLFYATVKKDVDSASEALLKLANAKDVDILAFNADMAKSVQFQHISGIREKKSDQYIRLGLKYNLTLPSTFIVLSRALVLLESTCLDLDPDLNIMDVAKPYVRKLTIEQVEESIEKIPRIIKEMLSGLKDKMQ